MTVLLSIAQIFSQWLKLCFNIFDIRRLILIFNVLLILDVLMLLMVIDLFDFEKSVDFFIIAISFINIFVIIFLLE